MKTYVFLVALVTCSLGVNAEPAEDHASTAASANSVGGHGATENVMGMVPSPIPPLTQEGKVLDVINTPKYTYVEVKLGDKTQWIAVQKLAVDKGNTILFDEGAPMSDFYSKTLERVFPSVIFVSNAGVCHTKEP